MSTLVAGRAVFDLAAPSGWLIGPGLVVGDIHCNPPLLARARAYRHLAEMAQVVLLGALSEEAATCAAALEDHVCCACLDAPATQCLLVCGHTALCAACSAVVAARGDTRCPICRAHNVSGAEGILVVSPHQHTTVVAASQHAAAFSLVLSGGAFVPLEQRAQLLLLLVEAARRTLDAASWERALLGLAALAAGGGAAGGRRSGWYSNVPQSAQLADALRAAALDALCGLAPERVCTAACFLLCQLPFRDAQDTRDTIGEDASHALLAVALPRLLSRVSASASAICVSTVAHLLGRVCAADDAHAVQAVACGRVLGKLAHVITRSAAGGAVQCDECVAAALGTMAQLLETTSPMLKLCPCDAALCAAAAVAAATAAPASAVAAGYDAEKVLICTRVLFMLCRHGHAPAARAAGGLAIVASALAACARGECNCSACCHAAVLTVRALHAMLPCDVDEHKMLAPAALSERDAVAAGAALIAVVRTCVHDRHVVWRACAALLALLRCRAAGDGSCFAAAVRSAVNAHSGLQIALDAAEEHSSDAYTCAHALSLAAAFSRDDAFNANAVLTLGYAATAVVTINEHAAFMVKEARARAAALPVVHAPLDSASLLLLRACCSLLAAVVRHGSSDCVTSITLPHSHQLVSAAALQQQQQQQQNDDYGSGADSGLSTARALSVGLLHLCAAGACSAVDDAQADAAEGLLRMALASPHAAWRVAHAGGVHALAGALAFPGWTQRSPRGRAASAAALALIVAVLLQHAAADDDERYLQLSSGAGVSGSGGGSGGGSDDDDRGGERGDDAAGAANKKRRVARAHHQLDRGASA